MFTNLIILLVYIWIFKLLLKYIENLFSNYTSLNGKTVIVTGVANKVGYETALEFAKRGARVIIACQNYGKGKIVQHKIVEKTYSQTVIVKILDLSSFDSIRIFADEINKTEKRLDILVNNPSVGHFWKKKTKNESLDVMQINYFSIFLLTHLLLDLMKRTGDARIVNISSNISQFAFFLNPRTIDKPASYKQAYLNSHLCKVLFTKELAKKLSRTTVTTYSAHPGDTRKTFYKHLPKLVQLIIKAAVYWFLKKKKTEDNTVLFCALEQNIEIYSGEHFVDCSKVKPYFTTRKPGISKSVWEITEKIVNLKVNEKFF